MRPHRTWRKRDSSVVTVLGDQNQSKVAEIHQGVAVISVRQARQRRTPVRSVRRSGTSVWRTCPMIYVYFLISFVL